MGGAGDSDGDGRLAGIVDGDDDAIQVTDGVLGDRDAEAGVHQWRGWWVPRA